MIREPIDKTGWEEGPWHSEPDEMDWVDDATGLQCLILRMSGGALCGYVGVKSHHPLFGKNYDDEEVYDLWCHGGLAFSESFAALWSKFEGYWFFGFDCAHSGDFSPGHAAVLRQIRAGGRHPGDSYRDLAFVKREVEGLARQLFEPLQALAGTLED